MTTENGRMLGRYQLLFMLGQGGMGEVHLARLTGAAGFEKLCIVKTVLPNLMGDQSFIDRFHHEARVLVQLTHSNIAQVYDMGEVDGGLYMAIEYVPGVDLSRVETRIERQAAVMPVPMAVFIGQKMCEALGYAHRKVGADGHPLGIVHRDVSPQNVMVSYEGEVKVIDFGLAKSTARSKHTLPSTVMGKLGYMSPEQAVAKPVDHRSDIFSAGIVIWEMLAGRSMYAGGTMSEMVAQMAVAEVPSLASVNPDIPPSLDQVVMRALAKDPAARYQRADEFARALNELAVREGLTVGAEDVGNYVRAMCPEEFAAERQLQSKLSVMRRKGVVPEVRASEPELEGTFMRPSGEVKSKTTSGQVMTPAQRAMTLAGAATPAPAPLVAAPARGHTVVQQRPPAAASQISEPIVVPRNRTPAIIGALVVLIALAGGALVFLQPSKQAIATPAPSPVVAQKTAEPAVTPEPAKPAEPAPTPEAPPEEATAQPLKQITVQGKTWKVMEEEKEYLLILEEGDKLTTGERLNLVGESAGEADGPRLLYGQAVVRKVTGSLVTLLVDEDVKVPEKVYAARDASPRKAPTVGRKEPVATRDDGKPAPAPEPTRPVKQSEPAPALTPEPEPVKVAEPAPEPAKTGNTPVQLFGTVRVSSPNLLGNRAVFLQNNTKLALSGCEVRLPNQLSFTLGRKVIPGNDVMKVPFKSFRSDARAPDPQFKANWAAVYCREGTGYWKTSFDQ